MTSYANTMNFLQSQASQAITRANNQASRIASMPNPALREPTFNHIVVKPTLAPPPNFSDMFDGGDDRDPTVNWLNSKADEWLSDYFPTITACLRTLPDEWLCGVISGAQPLGYSGTYFDLVWNQSRDRAKRATDADTALIRAEFSERGFSLPTGAMVDAIDRAVQRGTDAALEVNRAEAIKDAEIKLDLLKFAEQQALAYKLGVMQAMADFYRTWVSVPDKDIERARIRAQAMSGFYSALSSYYNVEVAFENLRLQAHTGKASTDLGVDGNRVAMGGRGDSANAALGQAVRGFADVAAQASGAASTLFAEVTAGI